MADMKKLLCGKARMAQNINVIFKSIDWIFFLSFSILAANFMIDVINQYQAKATSFSQSTESITKLPSIVMCIEGNHISNYTKEIQFNYGVEGKDRFHKNGIKEYHDYDFKQVNETFRVFQVLDKCIMLESNLSLPYNYGKRWITLTFEKSISHVHFYFTSKENSIGSVFRQWWDGQVLDIVIEAGYKARVSIQAYEKRYLDNQCSDVSHLEKLAVNIHRYNFKNFSRCSPSPFFSHVLPFCGWSDKKKLRQATKMLTKSLRKFTADFGYVRPCSILEYQGYKTHEEKRNDNNSVSLEYSFAPPFLTSVQQEYFIFDITGMIGSVGGTLGMCIGFSFSGVTTTILDFIKARILNNF